MRAGQEEDDVCVCHPSLLSITLHSTTYSHTAITPRTQYYGSLVERDVNNCVCVFVEERERIVYRLWKERKTRAYNIIIWMMNQ